MDEQTVKQPVQKTSPRDFFLHLLAIVTLYASAVAFTTLVFQYINYFLPDVLLDSSYLRSSILSSMRWSVASLLIIFPVYALTTRFLNKSYAKTPYLRNLRIRRWLIYFTLFVTALIIIGDLVALVFRLLGGEITPRFLLKVFALLFVTGNIFGYYFWDLREEKTFKIKPLVYGVIGLISAAIIGAFFVVGSPGETRLIRADQERTNDLQSIQWNIVNFWQSKERLPQDLSELEDDIRGIIVPVDPETGIPYEYSTKGPLTFELCATFARQSTQNEAPKARVVYPGEFSGEFYGGEFDTWKHGQGRTCFERTIDPDLYPPKQYIR